MSNFPRFKANRRDVLTRLSAGAALGIGAAATGRNAFAQTPVASPAAPPVAEADLSGVTHRRIQANGIELHIAEAGSGPLVVFVHGFPEIWYSWRHQLPALAAAGYHAVALDLRGYGESDAPDGVEHYSLRNHLTDLLGLFDALEAEQAVLVGHDIGAGITWAATELHPERVAAHVTLGIAYGPRPEVPPTEMIGQFAGDHFNFALYAQQPDLPESEFEADIRRSMRVFMYSLSGDAPPDVVPYLFEEKMAGTPMFDGLPDPEALPDWLSDDDLDVYVAAFEESGFAGAFNGYRNFDFDWSDLPEVGTLGIQQPALYIGGRRDPAVMYTLGALPAMEASVPDLRRIVLLPGRGHWTQQEQPDDVNAELLDFLQREIGW
jgi:pimeloyl-ACP methyl ester carboxylesterase